MTRTGCLLYKNNGFILQVDDSAEVLQLTGANLQTNLGNHVQINGVPAAVAATIGPASQIVNAAAALTAQTSMPAAGTPAPAGTSTPPAAGTAKAPTVAKSGGMSTGAKVAVIGAIGGGGAGAAVALSGKKKSTSP